MSNRLWTIPNVLSSLRLVGVPIFVWALMNHHDAIAVVTLMLSGFSDYLDGKIARTFGLESRLGQLLDPIADRLYILSTIVLFAWRDIIPWWLVGILLAREAFMAVVVLIARRYRFLGLPVHFIGKAATFSLLYAFPALLLAELGPGWAAWSLPTGWAFVWWGTVLYWVAGVIYAIQLRAYAAHAASLRTCP